MTDAVQTVTDEEIEAHIARVLADQKVVVDQDKEMGEKLKMPGVSTTRLMRRLGSMVERRLVLRCRREMESKDDEDRPITYKLYPKPRRTVV